MIFNGKNLHIKITGESRAEYVGAVMTGFPDGVDIDADNLAEFMKRRAATEEYDTPRREEDKVEFLSGLENGKTSGAVTELRIKNNDTGITEETTVPRPGHADYPAYVKDGRIPAGGGRFSGRMTAPLCAVGALCIQLLEKEGIYIGSHIYSIRYYNDDPFDPVKVTPDTFTSIRKKSFPVLYDGASFMMQEQINDAKMNGDSIGGVIECAITGLPVGLGDALFDGFDAKLAAAVLAVPAVKGVEFGAGFHAAELYGTENNDCYYIKDGKILTSTNNAGGIVGGMTNGMPVILRAALKPVPSVPKTQASVNLKTGENTAISSSGRNDACFVRRALPAIEAAVALVAADEYIDIMRAKKRNVFLVGMPGSGKSTVGKTLSALLGFEFLDTDTLISEMSGSTPEELIRTEGEARFRLLENDALRRVCNGSGRIIATGGGAASTGENRALMRGNGLVVFIDRELSSLDVTGRPLSVDIEYLYKLRIDSYLAGADFTVKNTSVAETAKSIAEILNRRGIK